MAKNDSAVLSTLGNRPFLFLWLGQIFSQLAINMVLFLLGLVVYQNTGSNTAVSGLFMAFGIPSVLFGMVAGAAVDRLDKRRVIIMSGVLRTLLVAGLLPAMHNTVLVYVLLFANAVVTQFYVPAAAPLIPRIVPQKHLVTANSLFSFAYYSSMAIGFIGAGPMLRFAGPFASIAILAVCFLLSTAFSWYLPRDTEGTVAFSRILRYDIVRLFARVYASVVDGVRYLLATPKLFDGVLLLTGTQIILAMLSTLGPGFADRVLGIDIRDVSLVMIGPVVVGMLLGSLWVGNFGYQYKPERLIRGGIMSAGIILMVISITVYLKRYAGFDWLFQDHIIVPLELMLFFLLGWANSLLDVPANSLLQKEAVGDMRGRVYGILAAAVGGVGILPVMVGGILADVIGVGKVIMVLGLFIVGYGIIRIRYNRR